MSDNQPPKSILELLTHPNPTVTERAPRNKTNTDNFHFHYPRQIKKWDEFYDFDTFKRSFQGNLMQAALQGGRKLPQYPDVDAEADCDLSAEDDTKDLIQKWNKTIVTAALRPIQDEFFPAIWRRGDPPSRDDLCEPPPRRESERTQPRRKCSDKPKGPKMQSLRRLRPDSGTSSRCPPQPGSSPTDAPAIPERFPKEYKPSTKWKSQWLREYKLVDESGEWVKGGMDDNMARPIRQAFTYCIRDMCRYGCILTCQEAFIFQVKPRDEKPGNGPSDRKALKASLRKNALMEYITIPWDSHSHGALESHNTWTINLALWFMHVLVGNDFQARWKYDPLVKSTASLPLSFDRVPGPGFQVIEEKEEEEDHAQEAEVSGDRSDRGGSEGTQEAVPIIVDTGMKRNWDSFTEDEYVHSVAGSFGAGSFYKRPTLGR